MVKDLVVLVDKNDRQVGVMEKMEAHKKALLHRAVSVFIINDKHEWILQRRASEKYHSSGLWTNTCCTHPFPNETNKDAAIRRLNEEMGMQTELSKVFDFIYKEKLDNELTEYELDHVFVGVSNATPQPNSDEASEWKTLSFEALDNDIKTNPENFTVWFRKIYKDVARKLNS